MTPLIFNIYFLLLSMALATAFFVIVNSIKNNGVDYLKPAPKYPPKKVAVCISGNFRNNVIESIHSIHHFITKPLNADVFLNLSTDVNEDDKKYILNMLQPKKYTFKDYTKVLSSGSYSANFTNMINRMYDCNELKRLYENETNTQYDIVIRIRPDFVCKNFVEPTLINSITDHVMYAYEHTVLSTFSFYGVSDIFFMATSRTMDFALRALVQTDFQNFKRFCQLSEYLVYKVFISSGLQVKLFYVDGTILKFTMPKDATLQDHYNFVKHILEKHEGVNHPLVCDVMNAANDRWT